jgi:hypothetical protein
METVATIELRDMGPTETMEILELKQEKHGARGDLGDPNRRAGMSVARRSRAAEGPALLRSGPTAPMNSMLRHQFFGPMASMSPCSPALWLHGLHGLAVNPELSV